MKEGKDLINNMIRKYLKLYRMYGWIDHLYELDYKIHYLGVRFR